MIYAGAVNGILIGSGFDKACAVNEHAKLMECFHVNMQDNCSPSISSWRKLCP